MFSPAEVRRKSELTQQRVIGYNVLLDTLPIFQIEDGCVICYHSIFYLALICRSLMGLGKDMTSAINT